MTEAQIAALEKAKADKEAHGEFDSECPGYCGAQYTCYVGTLKGVGGIYQQTVIDTTKVVFAKLYDRKTPITAAEILNDRVVLFYDEHGIRLSRMLTDRGTEFCGTQSHKYELYLAVEDIDHSRTKTKSPQTNGICKHFHCTVLDEFYRVAFRKKIYRTIDELQTDLDAWITEYNEQWPHQGRWCFGKTPMQTFLDALPLAKENSWRHDHRRQPYRFKQPTPSVRSSRSYYSCGDSVAKRPLRPLPDSTITRLEAMSQTFSATTSMARRPTP
jgi:hypothetical protein